MCNYLTALALQMLQDILELILKKVPDNENPLLMSPIGVGTQSKA